VIWAFYVDDHGTRYHVGCWANRRAILLERSALVHRLAGLVPRSCSTPRPRTTTIKAIMGSDGLAVFALALDQKKGGATHSQDERSSRDERVAGRRGGGSGGSNLPKLGDGTGTSIV